MPNLLFFAKNTKPFWMTNLPQLKHSVAVHDGNGSLYSRTNTTMLPILRRMVLRETTVSSAIPPISLGSRTYSSSSSKPSNNGNNNRRPAATTTTAAAAPPTNTPSTLVRNPVAEETPAKNEAEEKKSWSGIPFVPSTGHLRPIDIAVSTFFALHRPFSISSPLPTPTTAENMFASPPPQPSSPRKRTAWEHGAPFHAPAPPRREMEEPVDEDAVGNEKMHAISVRRQRKLKMKKHKYKKLMKKTRNSRRRIERQRS